MVTSHCVVAVVEVVNCASHQHNFSWVAGRREIGTRLAEKQPETKPTPAPPPR